MRAESGFTLIEMLISMAIGLVLIAGIAMIFVSSSKTSTALTGRTERMGDLFLASHLMQAAVRESKAMLPAPASSLPRGTDVQANGRCKPPASGSCLDPVTGQCSNTTKTVSLPNNYPSSFPYYPYWDSVSKTLTYKDLDNNTGIFQYQRTKTDRIYWLRPDRCAYKFEELMRDMDPSTGMVVTSPTPILNGTVTEGAIVSVVLQALYSNEQHQQKPLSLSFKVWPRNW